MTHPVIKTFLPLFAALALTAACSTQANDEDPLEGYNRAMFSINHGLDTVLIRPVAQGYRYITPTPVRTRIGNMSDNLYEPISMVNGFLQGDFTQGMRSFWRFIINSTVGLAGMHDVAAEAGIAPHSEDFGQTLAVWGVGSGPYIVLPLFGPSNLRDTTGMVADIFTSPVTYVSNDIWLTLGIAAGQALVERERLLDPIDDIYATSLDPYASFKSIYEQYRDAAIKNQHSDQPQL
ncbi:MAG: VacJ family lipoprotein [Alphaproteobacteria bacterium]|nr:VacJ family lipoprotein [Alphaproteobacteria bacterium]